MWAVLLGVILVLAAATSSHAAVYFKPQAALHRTGVPYAGTRPLQS